MLGFAPEERVDLCAPPCQLHASDGRFGGLVHHVVDLPAEGVQGCDGPPAFWWQEKKGVIETAATAGRFFLAILIRSHLKRALNAMRDQSAGRRTGRLAKTS